MDKQLKILDIACTGCGACMNACPQKAISLKNDIYGFKRPVILNKCNYCSLCETICPVIHQETKECLEHPTVYAAAGDDILRAKSSSGGVFSILSKVILAEGGIVYGASYVENFNVKHIGIQSEEELFKLQKSKYIQSEIGLIFQEIEKKLISGVDILFTGCPCQVSGLNAYLGKEYSNLISIDLICHGISSHQMLSDSLVDIEKEHKIELIDFRDKSIGWDCQHLKLVFEDSSWRCLNIDESRYEQGFHYNLTLNDCCYECAFRKFPRQGDISLGDFWSIDQIAPNISDGKGINLVLINTIKGKSFFEKGFDQYNVVSHVLVDDFFYQKIEEQYPVHPGRDYFLRLYPRQPFNKAVLYASQNKYDIGLVGNWSYPNYGSALTYYALYETLCAMGNSVYMIGWPRSSSWKPYALQSLFRNNPYPSYAIAPLVDTRADMKVFNNQCNAFIQGSDQLFNNNLYNWFDKFMQLDWVQSNKCKIAYAASFGCDYIWGSDNDRAELAHFMQEFDYFSVREQSGVGLAKEEFGVDAHWVIDPVFLVDRSVYDKLIDSDPVNLPPNKYLFTYILDPNQDKANALLWGAEKRHLSIRAALDGAIDNGNTTEEWQIETIHGLSVEQWLAHIKNADFIITDSFHGTCFAIIYRKDFIAINNSSRGGTRFKSLLESLGLEKRLLESEKLLITHPELFNESIDYDKVYSKLNRWKKDSFSWLTESLNLGIHKKKALSTFDLLSLYCDKLNKDNSQLQKQLQKIYMSQTSLADSLEKRLENTIGITSESFKARPDFNVFLDDYLGKVLDMVENNQHNLKILTEYIESYIKSNDEMYKICNKKTIDLSELINENTKNIAILNQYCSNINKYYTLVDDLDVQLRQAEKCIERVELSNSENLLKINNSLVDLRESLADIYHSKTYFVGNLIAWVPRKLMILLEKIHRVLRGTNH